MKDFTRKIQLIDYEVKERGQWAVGLCRLQFLERGRIVGLCKTSKAYARNGACLGNAELHEEIR